MQQVLRLSEAVARRAAGAGRGGGGRRVLVAAAAATQPQEQLGPLVHRLRIQLQEAQLELMASTPSQSGREHA